MFLSIRNDLFLLYFKILITIGVKKNIKSTPPERGQKSNLSLMLLAYKLFDLWISIINQYNLIDEFYIFSEDIDNNFKCLFISKYV